MTGLFCAGSLLISTRDANKLSYYRTRACGHLERPHLVTRRSMVVRQRARRFQTLSSAAQRAVVPPAHAVRSWFGAETAM